MLIELITRIAIKVGIESSLLLAVANVESNVKIVNYFNDNHSSYGIMQVELRTAREILPFVDSIALQQPEVNIYVAAKYLKKMQDRYGYIKGISAYNAGRPIESNKNYVKKVLDIRDTLNKRHKK